MVLPQLSRGKFWPGARQGLITSGLNHAIDHVTKNEKYNFELKFDGKKLHTYRNSELVMSLKAVSGREGYYDDFSVESQKSKGNGPLPEGNYTFDATDIQRITARDKLLGTIGRGDGQGVKIPGKKKGFGLLQALILKYM